MNNFEVSTLNPLLNGSFVAEWASQVAPVVKNLPSMQETHVRSLGQEDPLAKEMGSTLVFLSGESHGQRSLVGYSSWGCKESDTTEQLSHIMPP